MKKEDLILINEMESFLKLAMCIDGTCQFYKFVDIEIEGENQSSMLFELNDTRRGKFFIAMGKQLPKDTIK